MLELLSLCTTGEDLGSLLSRYQMAVLKQEVKPDPLLTELIARSDEFPADSPEQETGRQYAKTLTSIIGVDGMAGCLLYWQFRDQVRDYQLVHSISGLEKHTTTVRGQSLTYWDWNSQPHLLPEDHLTLGVEALVVAQQFIEWIEGYRLFSGDREDDNLLPCRVEDVEAALNGVQYATVYAQSIEWTGDTGHFVERHEPDEILLSLYHGSADDDEAEVRRFTALHWDTARF